MMKTSILVIAIACAGPAFADCALKPTKVEALGDTIGIFDKDGKFLSEMPKAALGADAKFVDCNENLGLVQVSLANGEVKWLDSGELRLTFADGAAKPKVCVVAATSRAA